RREIQQIVDELKRQSGVAPVIGERLLFFALETAEQGVEPRAATEKARGIVSSQPQSACFGYIDASDFSELNQFAFDHLLSQIDQNVEDAKIALLQSHLKRLHVQPVSGKHAAMIAPF